MRPHIIVLTEINQKPVEYMANSFEDAVYLYDLLFLLLNDTRIEMFSTVSFNGEYIRDKKINININI